MDIIHNNPIWQKKKTKKNKHNFEKKKIIQFQESGKKKLNSKLMRDRSVFLAI